MFNKTQKREWSIFTAILYIIKCAPISSGILIFHRVLQGLVPILQVTVFSNLINTAINISIGRSRTQDFVLPATMLILLIGYQWLSEELATFAVSKQSIALERNLSMELLEKCSKLEYQYIENSETLDLIMRVRSQAHTKFIQAFNSVLSLLALVINVVGVLWLVFTYVWWCSLIMLVLLIPLCMISLRGAKENYGAEKDISAMDRESKYFDSLANGKEAMEERTLFQYADYVNENYYNTYSEIQKIRMRVKRRWFIKMKMGSIMTSVVLVLMIFSFMQPTLAGVFSVGFFIAIVNSIFSLVQKMSWGLTSQVDSLTESHTFMKDICLFCYLDEVQDKESILEKNMTTLEKIEFRKVSFAYPGSDKQVLNEMSFVLYKDNHYAFVGANGSGKTTIIKLLSGLYTNYSGEILLNDRNLKEYSIQELQSFIGVLYADFARYFISLQDNILVGGLNIGHDEQRLQEIVQSLNMEKMIDDLPEKMQTPLGKIMRNGMDLSGGEWQRVAIARLLYNSAQLKILDEPTAALDPISESQLYQQFNDIMDRQFTILISHRLGSTKLADQILVVNEGHIVEQGTHDYLMGLQDGVYAQMYDAQRGWYV